MKKILHRSTLSVTAFLTAVVILSGCSPKTTDSSSSGSSAPATDSSSEAASSEVDRSPYAVTILANFGSEFKEWDTAYIEGIEKALNLDITWEAAPSTSYTERLQMMLASGEYPDLTIFPDQTDKMLVDAIREGVFIPLNEYIENSPNLKEYTYDISWDACKLLGDDDIYGIPRTSIARADGYMIRQDWLDAVGYTDVKEGQNITIDQMEEIANLFTKNDPDGNGANDTYGIGAYADSTGNMDVFFGPAFGLTGWKEYDGEYMDPKFSKDMDNFKRALTWSQKMWKAGLVDPDAPTIQRDISNDRFKKGIVGTKDEFPAYMEGTEKAGKELNPNYKLSYITGVVEKEGGKYTTATSSTGMWGVWCVSSTAEKPARLVEMLDYLISDEYWGNTMFGYEGMTFKVEDGDFKAIDEATATGGIGRNMMRRNDNAVFFSSIKKTPEENKRVLDLINTGIAQYEFPLDGGFRPAIADDPTFIDYEKNMKIQITKIIVGELSVDEWDGILDDWYTAGGETYIKQMQEHIASTKQ